MKKDGDITAPFRTNYGWHLLQRVNLRPLRSFEDKEMRSILKMDVQKNQRSQISVDSLVVKIKKENGFKLNNVAVDAVIQYLDSNFMNGKFDESAMPEMHKVTKMEGKKKSPQNSICAKWKCLNWVKIPIQWLICLPISLTTQNPFLVRNATVWSVF